MQQTSMLTGSRLNAAFERDSVVSSASRQVVLRTAGRRHGPITRLVSPSDIGQVLKPFVFLDRAEVPFTGQKLFGIHPHSGIATLTTVLEGGLAYEDTTGKQGEVTKGGLEWMKAGNGVWHDGGPLPGEALRLFQLWIALPADEENAAPESQYIPSDAVETDGPVRVILGVHGQARSVIRALTGIDYFHVQLEDRELWRYVPRAGHSVAWLAVDQGRLYASEAVDAGQLAVFDQSNEAIEVRAEGHTSFVFGSAVRHPHRLSLGRYSVHTNDQALAKGEREIQRIRQQLLAAGRI